MSAVVNSELITVSVPCEDPRLTAAMDSLNEEIQACKDRQLVVPSHAFLVDEWGLSGICMGYGLECVDWVDKHGTETPIPKLQKEWPQESIRHLSKLLILALYRSIGKETDPQKIHRIEADREKILKIVNEYEQLVLAQIGVKMGEMTPGPTFFESMKMSDLINEPSDGHNIFVMSTEHLPIFEWHVIYVNTQLGIIGDGGGGLLWKIDPASIDLFPEVLKRFVSKMNYDTRDAVRIRLEKSSTSSRMPLLMDRIFRRAQTALAIAHHSGPVMAAKYLYVINQHNPLASKFFKPDLKGLMHTLHDLGSDTVSPQFVSFIRSNLNEIGLIDDFSTSGARCPLYKLEYKEPEKMEVMLKGLEQIQKLGPKAEKVLSHLLEQILRDIPSKVWTYSNYPHIMERVIPALLALREKCAVPFDLTNLLCAPVPQDKHLAYYKLLIAAGADPRGSESAQKHKWTVLDQIDRTSENQPTEVIKYFEATIAAMSQ